MNTRNLIIALIILASMQTYAAGNQYVEIMTPKAYAEMSGDTIEMGVAAKNELATLGYMHSTDNNARQLMKTVSGEFDKRNFGLPKFANVLTSTHMKESAKDIPLTFKYKSIADTLNGKSIGYGAAGTFKSGKWTGITEYIYSNDIGACNMLALDMAANNGKIYVSEQDIKRVVNGNVTMTDVSGSNESGFSYNVEWVHSSTSYQLECATEKFDKSQLDKMIIAAKKIDGAISE